MLISDIPVTYSLEYVDSWNQPVLLRIEDVISDDGSRNNQEFKNAPLLAILSGIISNLQRAELLLFGGDIGLFSKPNITGKISILKII